MRSLSYSNAASSTTTLPVLSSKNFFVHNKFPGPDGKTIIQMAEI
jgi:hypothetical protein